MRRGWCPTLFEPMPSGDGWLARVKPPCGRLGPAGARALAEAAARHGNGVIELTNRANLQVRGLTEASASRFATEMVTAGLAHPDPVVERRRTVMLAPLASAGTATAAAALEALLADAALAELPGKFGFVVDDARGLPLAGGDVRLHRGETWLVWPDGAAMAAVCDDPAAAAVRLARAFVDHAPGARRMREVDPVTMFAAAGLRATAALPVGAPVSPIGALPGGFGVGLPFGATEAGVLASLAGFGDLVLTPWRAIIVVPGGRRAPELAALGLITDPSDPRLSLTTCPGRPACGSAEAATRDDAARLATLLPGIAIHLSGCAKGCAHPAPAAITLVARPDGYALIRDGRASDHPAQTGLTLEQAAAMLAS